MYFLTPILWKQNSLSHTCVTGTDIREQVPVQNIFRPLFQINRFCKILKFNCNTVKPILNVLFIKRNSVLNGNICRPRDYHSISWLNGNLASAEKCSGLLGFRFKTGFIYIFLLVYKNKTQSLGPLVRPRGNVGSAEHTLINTCITLKHNKICYILHALTLKTQGCTESVFVCS
jgi:hypothetical protein